MNIKTEVNGSVGIATLNRPEALNALNTELLNELANALEAWDQGSEVRFMIVTVLLGLMFLFIQGYEYHHLYTELNLKLSSGAYGSTFFMLTGLHGLHVFIGMLMLFFITLRIRACHFTPERHFGFEGAAWYWHFVDVVWLGLYITVYWL